MLAPLTPFVTERVWGDLFASTSFVEAGTPESVHLASWPETDAALIDDRLAQDDECLLQDGRDREIGRG